MDSTLTPEQQAALDKALANPATAYSTGLSVGFQNKQGMAANFGKALGGVTAALAPKGASPTQATPQPNMPALPAPPAPAQQPYLGQQAPLNHAVDAVVGHMAEQTGFDIHKPYGAMNLRALQNPNARQDLKPYPEQTQSTDPITNQPITPEGYSDASGQIFEKQKQTQAEIDQAYQDINAMHFNPTQHHTTKGSEIAAGITLLLGTLLGRRSPALGGGLLQGLTNTVANIDQQHKDQYARENNEFDTELQKKQLALSALKDKQTGLDSMAVVAQRQQVAEEKKRYDDMFWKKFTTHENDWIKDTFIKNKINQSRANAYIQSVRQAPEIADARNALGYAAIDQRADMATDLNRYRMAEILIQNRRIDNTWSPEKKNAVTTAQSTLQASIKTLNDNAKAINASNKSDDEKRALITAAFANAHPQIEAQLNYLSTLGIDTQDYAAEASAVAAEYAPEQFDTTEDRAAYRGYTAPASAQPPVIQYIGTQPGATGSTDTATGANPAAAGGAPPPQGWPAGPTGVGQPQTPTQVPLDKNSAPPAPLKTPPQEAIDSWNNATREEQEGLLRQYPNGDFAPWMKAHLKPAATPAPPHNPAPHPGHNPKAPPHTTSEIKNGPPPAPEPPTVDPKAPARMTPTIVNGVVKSTLLRHVPAPPKGVPILDASKPVEGAYYFNTSTGKWTPYVRDAIGSAIGSGLKALMHKPAPSKPGETPGYPAQHIPGANPYAP